MLKLLRNIPSLTWFLTIGVWITTYQYITDSLVYDLNDKKARKTAALKFVVSYVAVIAELAVGVGVLINFI